MFVFMSPMFTIILFSKKVPENNLGDVTRKAELEGWDESLKRG